MRSTLAIYITLFAIAAVAIAQILYWRLGINRRGAAGDPVPEGPDMGWGLDPADPWAGLETDATKPVLVSEPVLVGA